MARTMSRSERMPATPPLSVITTAAPMCRRASSCATSDRLALRSTVTTSRPLSLRMCLTCMALSSIRRIAIEVARASFDHPVSGSAARPLRHPRGCLEDDPLAESCSPGGLLASADSRSRKSGHNLSHLCEDELVHGRRKLEPTWARTVSSKGCVDQQLPSPSSFFSQASLVLRRVDLEPV